jgi:hypothetical protein
MVRKQDCLCVAGTLDLSLKAGEFFVLYAGPGAVSSQWVVIAVAGVHRNEAPVFVLQGKVAGTLPSWLSSQ